MVAVASHIPLGGLDFSNFFGALRSLPIKDEVLGPSLGLASSKLLWLPI